MHPHSEQPYGDVVVVDGSRLMPAVEALAYFDAASAAITRYEQAVAEGRDVEHARWAAMAAARNSAREAGEARVLIDAVANVVAETAVELFDLYRQRGVDAATARRDAAAWVAEEATALDPELQAVEIDGEGVRVVGEIDVNDADWSRPWRTDIPEREPEPGSWIARNLPARDQLTTHPELESTQRPEPAVEAQEHTTTAEAAAGEQMRGVESALAAADAALARIDRCLATSAEEQHAAQLQLWQAEDRHTAHQLDTTRDLAAGGEGR